MADLRQLFLFGLAVVFSAATGMAHDGGFSKDDGITPERVGLPKGSTRTSEPFVTRVYKTDDNDDILKKQPEGYPFTVTADYTLKDNETARVHEGVDLSSPAPDGKRVPLDFTAGVYGVVVKAGDGPWGTITVQIQDGSLIQYLHTTLSHVKVGDIVAPDTKLGATGRHGGERDPLAHSGEGQVRQRDLARSCVPGRSRKLESKEKPDKPDPDQIDFDPTPTLP